MAAPVLTLAAALWACATAASPAQRDTGAQITAFVNVAVVPMDKERVLESQTVLVRGGRITALGPADRVRVPVGARRIDGSGKFLVPGLADLHTHIAHQVDSADAEHVLVLMVAHGVTTIRNMDYDPDDKRDVERVLRFRARAAAGTLLSPRIYTSGPWGPKQYTDHHRRAGDPAPVLDSVAAYVAAYKAAGYDFLKIHSESREIVDAVAAAARRLGVPVVGHLPEQDEPYTVAMAVRAGYRSIEHLSGYHKEEFGIPPDAPDQVIDTTALPALVAIAKEARRAGVWHCPTQAVIEWVCERFGPNNGGGLPLRRRVIKALQDAGAGLLLGTDENVSTHDRMLVVMHFPAFSAQAELAALVRAGLTPYQALVTGTRNAAVYFGTLAESGTVAAGKRADLVLLDGNPLVDIENTNRIAGVMLAGRWLSRTDLDSRLASFASPPAFSEWRPGR